VSEEGDDRMLALDDLTENQLKRLKESFTLAVPVEAIEEPLTTAQQGFAKVSEQIDQVKDASHLGNTPETSI
jgi:hypothetical protein